MPTPEEILESFHQQVVAARAKEPIAEQWSNLMSDESMIQTDKQGQIKTWTAQQAYDQQRSQTQKAIVEARIYLIDPQHIEQAIKAQEDWKKANPDKLLPENYVIPMALLEAYRKYVGVKAESVIKEAQASAVDLKLDKDLAEKGISLDPDSLKQAQESGKLAELYSEKHYNTQQTDAIQKIIDAAAKNKVSLNTVDAQITSAKADAEQKKAVADVSACDLWPTLALAHIGPKTEIVEQPDGTKVQFLSVNDAIKQGKFSDAIHGLTKMSKGSHVSDMTPVAMKQLVDLEGVLIDQAAKQVTYNAVNTQKIAEAYISSARAFFFADMNGPDHIASFGDLAPGAGPKMPSVPPLPPELRNPQYGAINPPLPAAPAEGQPQPQPQQPAVAPPLQLHPGN